MKFVPTALRIFAGAIVWALHFAVIYGVTGVACARGAPAVAVAGVTVATIVAVALLVPVVVAGWRRRDRFEDGLGSAVGAFALVAVLWEALPALLIEACR